MIDSKFLYGVRFNEVDPETGLEGKEISRENIIPLYKGKELIGYYRIDKEEYLNGN